MNSGAKRDEFQNFGGTNYKDFALEVGLIVAGLGAYYLIAEPILNKLGVRPVNF